MKVLHLFIFVFPLFQGTLSRADFNAYLISEMKKVPTAILDAAADSLEDVPIIGGGGVKVGGLGWRLKVGRGGTHAPRRWREF